jgi:hypothetical protein
VRDHRIDADKGAGEHVAADEDARRNGDAYSHPH